VEWKICGGLWKNTGREMSDVQTLNTFADALQATNDQDTFLALIQGAARVLEPDDLRKLARGKRGEFKKKTWGCDSRSGAYELEKAWGLILKLSERGLIDVSGDRPKDKKTGKYVLTRARELTRIFNPDDPDDPEAVDVICENWDAFMQMDLDELKLRVWYVNPRAKK